MGDRAALEAQVDRLAEEHVGREFVAAVEKLAADLGPEDRLALEEILLARSSDSFRDAIAARVESKGWIRRQLDKADERPPPKI